jgi:hypothetical protein
LFAGTEGYFEAKSKGYNAIVKRAVKENPLEMGDIFRNKKSISKRANGNEFMK